MVRVMWCEWCNYIYISLLSVCSAHTVELHDKCMVFFSQLEAFNVQLLTIACRLPVSEGLQKKWPNLVGQQPFFFYHHDTLNQSLLCVLYSSYCIAPDSVKISLNVGPYANNNCMCFVGGLSIRKPISSGSLTQQRCETETGWWEKCFLKPTSGTWF